MEEAEHLADSIVVLDAGRVVADGTADELKDHLGGNVLEIRVSHRADLERAASLVTDLGSAALGWIPSSTRSACRSAAGPAS
jgi:ABC-type multidrug transport system ATPase subunit